MKAVRTFLLASSIVLFPGGVMPDEPVPARIVLPVPDAERGRALFGSKGCVVCHSLNGVGGRAGPALDADGPDGEIDPLDFVARMWSGARAMVSLQEMELGYQIELSGGELADLAAFLANEEERNAFTEDDVTADFKGWTIDAAIMSSAVDGTGDGTGDGTRQVTRGYVLAERWCADCHVLRPGDAGGVAGPTFAEIARKPDASATAIIGWLAQPHAEMPEILRLTDADLEDLAAYIMSVRF